MLWLPALALDLIKALTPRQSRQGSLLGWSTLAVLTMEALFAATATGTKIEPVSPKRPVTAADGITMFTLADPEYFLGYSAERRVATFSPDGTSFVIVLRRGDLQNNTNEFSILLFRTAAGGALGSIERNTIVTMTSSSNRDAIKNVKWLNDNQRITFLGETPGQNPQVYSFNVTTRELKQLTHSSAPINNYDISMDGRVIVFTADPPARRDDGTERGTQVEVVIHDQALADLLCGESSKFHSDSQLFLQLAGQTPHLLPANDSPREDYQMNPISVSSDGNYALVEVSVQDVPPGWSQYLAKDVRPFVEERRRGREPSRLRRFLLLNVRSESLTPLIDAPMQSFDSATWSPDLQSVFVKGTYLPLDVADPLERRARENTAYDVEVLIQTKEIRKSANLHPTKSSREVSKRTVSLEEDVNTAPKIYALNPATHEKSLLIDLNPQFAGLQFGRVDVIHWKGTDGRDSEGGLYLPADYNAGARYPLIIQTHGFDPKRFSMDGRLEWSSAFAARPLAAVGFVVLQCPMFADSTPDEGPREMARYQGAIDYLDHRGVIDRNRVGIVGFSRTVFEVGYTLTHSTYQFAAASLVDGMDGGYFQYLAFGPRDNASVNGGDPFDNGLKRWFQSSPGFNLARVNAPVRLLSLGPSSVIAMWEWFSGLTQLNKPVEFIYLHDAPHLLVRPRERLAAQQGLVDWLCFWVLKKTDADPPVTHDLANSHRSEHENPH
jgi:dipeptidyl aminopeptidase/acylaminoacyl peptidase